ncbi:hypothetical protein ABZ949_02100 [Micromonospora tulbaghiae]|uniref:hypothetical protein n=1 Tax=Micromonospora tulbaghiae TaxID=479978 RepID=UPI00340FCE53
MTEQTITRDDLTIEHGTARWGGPTATITINTGTLAGRRFWLRSTQGLDNDTTNDLAKGGGIHVDAAAPDSARSDWRGAFKTYDMDEAINSLVDEINDWAARDRVQEATWAELSALSDAVTAFNDSLEERSLRDFRREWQRVQETVAALDMKMREADRG